MSCTNTPPRMLNLGCGATFHPDWVNLDIASGRPEVLAYDLYLGVPFADESFDLIYHSHVLEHLERPWAAHLLRECFRALRPGGLLRVAVPDLENIVRAYLQSLEAARAGNVAARERHQWMSIELLDQLCRTESGGDMLRWWARDPMPQEEFILSRMGGEMSGAVAGLRRSPSGPAKKRSLYPPADPAFAQSGELHRWMYDALSLGAMLDEAGFTGITRTAYNESSHPEFWRYGLDMQEDGTPRKPDSLFMEARKPDSGRAKPIRVALLCTTDHGGAGTAALRQHLALREIGSREENERIISHFYCAAQKSTEEAVSCMPVRGQRLQRGSRTAYLSGLGACEQNREQALAKYSGRPPGREYFSLPQICCDPVKTPLFDDFAVVNLHWTSCMFDPALAPESLHGKAVVWTLHDMAAFTGGCHYSAGCTRFTEHCGACPELGSDDPDDLSFATWRTRMGAYRNLQLHIVCPSAWLAGEARKSSLLGRFPVHVVPYAQPLDVFRPLAGRESVRRSLGIAPEECVLLFAAHHLRNERKGGIYLDKALRILAGQAQGRRFRLLLLGQDPPAAFMQLGLHADAVGHIDDPEHMAVLYNAADAVVVPSLEDNSPNVICESLGCGTPVVAFAAGGIPEMLRHEESGWLAPVGDDAGLAAGMSWADAMRGNAAMRLRCRAFALEKWNPVARARDYARLFAEIVQQTPPILKG